MRSGRGLSDFTSKPFETSLEEGGADQASQHPKQIHSHIIELSVREEVDNSDGYPYHLGVEHRTEGEQHPSCQLAVKVDDRVAELPVHGRQLLHFGLNIIEVTGNALSRGRQ